MSKKDRDRAQKGTIIRSGQVLKGKVAKKVLADEELVRNTRKELDHSYVMHGVSAEQPESAQEVVVVASKTVEQERPAESILERAKRLREQSS